MQMPTSRAFEVVLDERHERFRARELVRDDLERQLDAGSIRHLEQRLNALPCGIAAVVRRAGSARVRHAEVHDEVAERNRLRHGQRCFRFRHGALRRASRPQSRWRTSRPTSPWTKLAQIGACTEFSSSRVSSSHSASASHGDAVVVIEVGPRGEHLDAVEAVRGDLDQVVAVEPLVVEQVRRTPKRRLLTGSSSARMPQTTYLTALRR